MNKSTKILQLAIMALKVSELSSLIKMICVEPKLKIKFLKTINGGSRLPLLSWSCDYLMNEGITNDKTRLFPFEDECIGPIVSLLIQWLKPWPISALLVSETFFTSIQAFLLVGHDMQSSISKSSHFYNRGKKRCLKLLYFRSCLFWATNLKPLCAVKNRDW